MINPKRIVSTLVISMAVASSPMTVIAQEKSASEKSGSSDSNLLSYPELQVSPKASERISMEAKIERGAKWENQIPLQLSALSTLAAGLHSSSAKPDDAKVNPDDAEWARRTTFGVGAAWLVASYFLTDYTPYIAADNNLRSMPRQSTQDLLTRERIAEEAIDRAASNGRKVMWLSVLSNLSANLYLASKTSKEGSITAGVAALMSFAPVLFPYKWISISEKHRDYKKRIYGPIVTNTVFPIVTKNQELQFVPGLSLTMNF